MIFQYFLWILLFLYSWKTQMSLSSLTNSYPRPQDIIDIEILSPLNLFDTFKTIPYSLTFGIQLNSVKKEKLMKHKDRVEHLIGIGLGVESERVNMKMVSYTSESSSKYAEKTYCNIQIDFLNSWNMEDRKAEEIRLRNLLLNTSNLKDLFGQFLHKGQIISKSISNPSELIIFDRIQRNEHDPNHDIYSSNMDITIRFFDVTAKMIQAKELILRQQLSSYLQLHVGQVLLIDFFSTFSKDDGKDVLFTIILSDEMNDKEKKDEKHRLSSLLQDNQKLKIIFEKSITYQKQVLILDINLQPYQRNLIHDFENDGYENEQSITYHMEDVKAYPTSYNYIGCPWNFCLHFVWDSSFYLPLYLDQLDMEQDTFSSFMDINQGKGALIYPGNETLWTFGTNSINRKKMDLNFHLKALPIPDSNYHATASLTINSEIELLLHQNILSSITATGPSLEEYDVTYTTEAMNEKEVYVYIKMERGLDDEFISLIEGCDECHKKLITCQSDDECSKVQNCLDTTGDFQTHFNYMKVAQIGTQIELTSSLSECSKSYSKGWMKYQQTLYCYMESKCPLGHSSSNAVTLRNQPAIQSIVLDMSPKEFIIKVGISLHEEFCSTPIIIQKKEDNTLEYSIEKPLLTCLSKETQPIINVIEKPFSNYKGSFMELQIHYINYWNELPSFLRIHSTTHWNTKNIQLAQAYIEASPIDPSKLKHV